MTVRLVQAQDHSEWLRLRMALWPDCPLADHLNEMATYLADPDTFAVFVAERPEGGLCGLLEVSLHPFAYGCDTQPVGYLEGWYVDPDMRRQGIGKALVAAAEAWARAQGCVEMASDCELDNTLSLQAHLAIGYEEVERLIHFRKPLSP